MSEFVLAVINVHTPPSGSTLVAGDTLKVVWDDVSLDIEVYKNNVIDTTQYDIGSQSSNYSFLYGVSSQTSSHATAAYSFCDSTTLNWFRMLTTAPAYPYFEKVLTVNSPVCGSGSACDIHFDAPLDITHCTDLTSNNGQVIASATSSNADVSNPVKYGLSDFTYATEGQTSGTIAGLSPGEYTLYTKDANDCTAQIDFKILFKPAYAEHYRFTWTKITIGSGNTTTSRARIYEREYAGDVVEVSKGTDSPFILNKPKQGDLNDKFYPVHPTSAVLSLMSQYDYQFLPLYTDDNKKFKVVYELDDGGGFDVIWSGFIIPSVYREMFRATPYPSDIQIADNVKALDRELFTDDNGNLLNGDLKLIKVISFIMKKTGLELNIRSGINIFESNHNTAATDDPLDQTYVDVSCYRRDGEPFTCWEVLESILRPFGARIYQEDNSWIIEEINRSTTTYAYRVFDADGVYSSNSTFNPIVDIKNPDETERAAFVGDGSMEIVPAYGKVSVVSKLNFVGTLVTGGFEKEDLLSPGSEVFNESLGVFSSEEGFKDWTLRYNGVSGVSFGRVVIGNTLVADANGNLDRINEFYTKVVKMPDTKIFGDFIAGPTYSTTTPINNINGEKFRSVGAFFFNPNGWSGNLRDAYIESAARPYQYSVGSTIKVSFEYSTPASSNYPFMVLRFVLKVGDQYLQENLSWSTTEHIYRAYPKVSSSLQRFEITARAPSTAVPVDSTVQLRIYYYAADFYDHGLPPPSDSTLNSDGTDGLSSLDTVVTTDKNYVYQTDVRIHHPLGSKTAVYRYFLELRFSDSTENLSDGIIRAGDFDSTTNPAIFYAIGAILEGKSDDDATITNENDKKFYIDNVVVDTLTNGQEPPKTSTIDLAISKYINEALEVQLYNFDCPDITNAKNMYNNYFKLSDGAPTETWARSGVSEALPIQQILLKVLGANHSAPTFRLTGQFINEFFRVGINNALRLTKAGSDLSLSNTTFTADLTGWSQTGSGTAFAWSADNSGSAAVTLTGATDSQKIYQNISHSGGYVTSTVNLKVVPAATNDREDVLWLVYFVGTSIVHTEKMKTFSAPTSESDYSFTHTHFVPSSVTRIGFYIKNVNGTDSCTYQFTEFSPVGTAQQEVYQIADYSFDDNNSSYTLELMQLSKSYISLQGTDQGGDNQGGDDEGQSFSGGYSSGYGGGFDTVLN